MKFIITASKNDKAEPKEFKKLNSKKELKKFEKIVKGRKNDLIKCESTDESMTITIVDDIETAKKIYILERGYKAFNVKLEVTD